MPNRQSAESRSAKRHKNWKQKKQIKKEQEKFYTSYVDSTYLAPTYDSYNNHTVGNSFKVQNNELSQLRVILEQNEAKELATTTAGLLERRNVRLETPSSLSDHPNGIGNGNGGAVPPSPNTRRMAFNFTPISPRLTPDVPPSPGSSGQPLHLRQLLSTQGGGTSPLVSPGQTSVPSSFTPSQPHSGHNSGHFMMNMDTPASFVTESISDRNDSAYFSPLTTSVNRSRNNLASNLLVNRVRDSAVALNSVRHMPYAKPSLMNHGQDVLFNASDRSHHSSGGQSKKQKKQKIDKRLPEQQYQPAFYYKPISSTNVPAAVQSTILVGNLCRLAGTERRLITSSKSSTAASPVVPLCKCSNCRAKSALYSKKVSIFRKPEIAISNEPTRFQPKYHTYFALADKEINDGADSREKSAAVDGSSKKRKHSHNSRSSRPDSREKSAAVDGSSKKDKRSHNSRSSRLDSREISATVNGSSKKDKRSHNSRSSRLDSREKSATVDGSSKKDKRSHNSRSSRLDSREKSSAVADNVPEEGVSNSSLDLNGKSAAVAYVVPEGDSNSSLDLNDKSAAVADGVPEEVSNSSLDLNGKSAAVADGVPEEVSNSSLDLNGKSAAVADGVPDIGDSNSSLDLNGWLAEAVCEQILNSLKNFPLDINDIDL